MKKILTTTALVSATLLAGVNVASAQTTITGQLDLGFKALESKSLTAANSTAKSYQTFTRESQINVGYKGKLNNGIDFAAGFSWEVDGNEAVATGSFGENTYLDFTMGGTTLTISADHIQNPDFEITNIAGGKADIDDVIAGAGGGISLASTHKTNTANSAYSGHGIGLIQNFGVAKASIYWAPNRTAGAATADNTSDVTRGSAEAGNSQYEVLIDGDFGVKGARAFYYQGKSKSDVPGTANVASDLEGKKYGLGYNFGQFTLAASKSDVTSTSNVDASTKTISAGYAVNKDLTVNVIRAKTNADGTATTAASTTATETLKGVNVGYNLGPVTLNAWYVDGSDVGGTAGNDGKAVMFITTTKF
jgi:hypothetical protein